MAHEGMMAKTGIMETSADYVLVQVHTGHHILDGTYISILVNARSILQFSVLLKSLPLYKLMPEPSGWQDSPTSHSHFGAMLVYLFPPALGKFLRSKNVERLS